MLVAPPPELCTDNGAMIAWAGCERLALGLTDTLDVAPRARWPLDPAFAEVTAVSLARIAVVGAGAWGTALANCAARAGREVTLWARDPAAVADMVATRESPRLPGVRLDERVAATGAIADLAHARGRAARGSGAGPARRRERRSPSRSPKACRSSPAPRASSAARTAS